MKTTGQLLENYQIPNRQSRRTERGDLLEYFHQRINALRKEGGYREFSFSALAYFLKSYSVSDLYLLKGKCENAVNWGATFNYFVFPKKGLK